MSVERAERTGPTEPGASDWNTAARRVMPPSTCSSKTMSAWLIPAWGRARGPLSILTTRAGRAGRPSGPANPVRGPPPGGEGTGAGPVGPAGRLGAGAVVADDDVVGATVVVVGSTTAAAWVTVLRCASER